MRESLRRAASTHWDDMSPEQAVEEAMPTLHAAAQAVAESLHGSPLKDTRLAQQLQNVLLAESPDASKEAQARCRAIREAFAQELHLALLQRGAPTEVGQPQPLRVEVRGTAGRVLLDRALAVGSQAECDVQVFGDEAVLPLQFVVVVLPFCTVVADFWSGETRATWRMSVKNPGMGVSAPQGATFTIAPEERVVFQVGANSTVALGPSVEKLQRARRKAARTFGDAFCPSAEAEKQDFCPKKCRKSSSASTSCGSLLEDSRSAPDLHLSRSDSPHAHGA
eukprot:CAMPEP_0181446526 /NCGR_PEP_ID=MMETSP1110-20121109/26150_1 /TAXON_ID=174948 /ORGANISM="Symbiodinium sp., Strain CCMP421" /LENGTH=279 /DNA_ID=CAMNT_0023570607 /DNA_START=39 /DNA_END=878 /DNA_ORIENTATION=-